MNPATRGRFEVVRKAKEQMKRTGNRKRAGRKLGGSRQEAGRKPVGSGEEAGRKRGGSRQEAGRKPGGSGDGSHSYGIAGMGVIAMK